MKPYSLDLREKIISTYEAGNTSIRQVAARFQVSKIPFSRCSSASKPQER
ncbi:MAG: hypothetical protein EDM05_054245 [Leptolyngbya sp. IPPAS B-1204]